MAHLRVTPLSCLSLLFFLIFTCFPFKRGSSCFFVHLYTYRYISLLAFVSEFYSCCFFRSRCSMEMWCPDDTGRDCLDWFGFGREYDSTPQSRVEAPRLLKNGASPVCIVVVVVVVVVPDA